MEVFCHAVEEVNVWRLRNNISNDDIELILSLFMVVLTFVSLTAWRRYNNRALGPIEGELEGHDEIDTGRPVAHQAQDKLLQSEGHDQTEDADIALVSSLTLNTVNVGPDAENEAEHESFNAVHSGAPMLFSAGAVSQKAFDALEMSKAALMDVCAAFEDVMAALQMRKTALQSVGNASKTQVTFHAEVRRILEKAVQVRKSVRDVREKIRSFTVEIHSVSEVGRNPECETTKRTASEDHVSVKYKYTVAAEKGKRLAKESRDLVATVKRVAEEIRDVTEIVKEVAIKAKHLVIEGTNLRSENQPVTVL